MSIKITYIPSEYTARWIYGPLAGSYWRHTWEWQPTPLTVAVENIESFKQ